MAASVFHIRAGHIRTRLPTSPSSTHLLRFSGNHPLPRINRNLATTTRYYPLNHTSSSGHVLNRQIPLRILVSTPDVGGGSGSPRQPDPRRSRSAIPPFQCQSKAPAPLTRCSDGSNQGPASGFDSFSSPKIFSYFPFLSLPVRQPPRKGFIPLCIQDEALQYIPETGRPLFFQAIAGATYFVFDSDDSA